MCLKRISFFLEAAAEIQRRSTWQPWSSNQEEQGSVLFTHRQSFYVLNVIFFFYLNTENLFFKLNTPNDGDFFFGLSSRLYRGDT